ncbi:hypothetical protein DXG01_002644 [Tephrocybe rancida]|nr:hypothetical protein DXG01_002644 [Tephrocybe rancida]
MARLTIVEARIASFFVEGVILGFYLVTFYHTLVSLFYNGSRLKRWSEVNHAMAIVAIVMFINTTLASATGFVIVWRAFVIAPPGTATQSFSQITYWAIVLKSATLLTQTTIGDAMLIYRCWVVYSRSWRVIAFSIILWLGGFVCEICLVYYEITAKSNVLVSASNLHPFGTAFWASTVALNVITTALLVWPIWRVARHHDEFAYHTSSSQRNDTMKHVMQVIIESGAIYTTMAFLVFVTYTTKSNSLYITSSAEVGIAGIAFNLIIIRTAKVTRNRVIVSGVPGSLPLHIMSPRETAVPDDKTHNSEQTDDTTMNTQESRESYQNS